MASASSGQAEILSTISQFTKTFIVYEAVTFRMLTIYEAPTDAGDQAPCTRTDYEYDGASTRILKSKEQSALWDATWDI